MRREKMTLLSRDCVLSRAILFVAVVDAFVAKGTLEVPRRLIFRSKWNPVEDASDAGDDGSW